MKLIYDQLKRNDLELRYLSFVMFVAFCVLVAGL